MSHLLAWFGEYGWNLSGMVEAWHANRATSGLVWGLTISVLALTVWVVAESVRDRRWAGLVVIPAAFGVSCGLPFCLFLRSRTSA
jgi:uncharacterized membrane protein YhdT